MAKSDIEAGSAFVKLWLKDEMTKKLVASIKKAGDSMKSLGASMMKLGGMITGPMAAGLVGFAKFEAKMGDVATMLEDPGEFLPGYFAGVKQLAADFGKTKDELTTGLYDILSATVPPEQAMERLAAATKLAAAGNADVGASVSALNTLMETYGDSFRDAGDASDFLFAIVKRGRTNLSELSGSLGNIIAASRAAGLSAEDMGASVALLTRATGKTDTALTALQAIAGTFLKPSTEGAKFWKETFGDEMNTATMRAIGMAGVLERLSSVGTDDIGKMFPNMRALRGIFPALSKLKGFGDDLAGMSDRAGNVQEAFEKGAGPLREWEKAMERIKNIWGTIGSAVSSAIMPFVPAIQTIGEKVQKWVEENKQIVVTVAAIGGSLLVAGTALFTFGTLISGVMAGVGAVVTAVTSAVGLLTAAVGFLLSPIGAFVAIVGGSVVASIALVVAESEKFRDTVAAAFNTVLGTAKKVGSGIADAFAVGDLELSWKIAMAGLDVIWRETLDGMLDVAIQWAADLRGIILKNIGGVAEFIASPGALTAKRLLEFSGFGGGEEDASDEGFFARREREKAAARNELNRLNMEAAKKRRDDSAARASQNQSSPGGAGQAGAGGSGQWRGGASEEESQAIADAENRLHKLRLESIADEQQRAIALINHRYDVELSRSQAVGAEKAAVEAARALEIAAVQRDYDKRRHDANQQLQDENTRLAIQAATKGHKQKMALLALEEKQALRDAAPGTDQNLIRRQFELRRQLLAQEAEPAAPARIQMGATYSAAAAAISGFTPGSSNPQKILADTMTKVEGQAKKTAENTAKLIDLYIKVVAGQERQFASMQIR